MIECQNCKGNFIQDHYNEKYCSKNCAYKFRKSVEIKRKHKKNGYSGYGFIKCNICESKFKMTSSRSKYCSDGCSILAKRKRKNNYQKKYHKNNKKNPSYVFSRFLRTSLNKYILKEHKSNKYCNFSANDFFKRIEETFQEGMSWENWGEWHIDHIKPLSSFDFIKNGKIDWTEVHSANSLDNLQALWAKDNLRKHNKVYI